MRRGPSLMRDAYVAQPSRLIAPETEKELLNKLLHDPRGERLARRRAVDVSSSGDDQSIDSMPQAAPVESIGPITMPTRDDRQRVWNALSDGNGALTFDRINQAVVELFCDRVWHESSSLRALTLAYRSVNLDREGRMHRPELTVFLQHIVYFANRAQLLDRAEAECQLQQGKLTLGEFLRAAAAVGASVNKATAVDAFRTMAADNDDCAESIPFDDFCKWCAQRHISQVRTIFATRSTRILNELLGFKSLDT